MGEHIVGYSEKISQALIGGQPFTITDRMPIFESDADRLQEKKKIESALYLIFSKYIA